MKPPALAGPPLAALLLAGAVLCTTASAGDAPNVDGTWLQDGYGVILDIRGEKVRLFDRNAIECHLSETRSLEDLGSAALAGDRRLEVRYGINHYRFRRLASVPNECDGSGKPIADPLLNFDSAWQTLAEHYAFFGIRGVDWPALRDRYRSRVDESTGDLMLFATLREMFAELHDDHVSLEVPEKLAGRLRRPEGEASHKRRFELEQRAREALVSRYVARPQSANAGVLRWGLIEPEVGYVQINAMLMLGDYGLGEVTSLREFFERYFEIAEERPCQYQDEVAGARTLMARVLADLSSTKALILDLRFNGGGKDQAGLEFLRPFVTRPTLAFEKKARTEDGHTAPTRVVLQPIAPAYTGEVFLLTSPRTASAAEVVVLASLSLPRVTRIGSATEGIFSDTLDKTLPNGWSYTLSNEIYISAGGSSYESAGVPPDHVLPYSRDPQTFLEALLTDLEHPRIPTPGRDAAVEQALALAKARREPSAEQPGVGGPARGARVGSE